MKVLNLYAGIGGNRKLWKDVEVTAVENNKSIAKIYQNNFPDDKVIICDAHKYLLEHYKEFDFIWSSPPCQTHSGCNIFLNAQGVIRYPDMKLWQEILFLKQFAKKRWVVENVISYYEPFIKPQKIGRHCFWSNFNTMGYEGKFTKVGRFGPTKKGRTDEKLQIKRNCVNSELGLHVFKCAFKIKQQTLSSHNPPNSSQMSENHIGKKQNP